jgi:hypothetical protein
LGSAKAIIDAKRMRSGRPEAELNRSWHIEKLYLGVTYAKLDQLIASEQALPPNREA